MSDNTDTEVKEFMESNGFRLSDYGDGSWWNDNFRFSAAQAAFIYRLVKQQEMLVEAYSDVMNEIPGIYAKRMKQYDNDIASLTERTKT